MNNVLLITCLQRSALPATLHLEVAQSSMHPMHRTCTSFFCPRCKPISPDLPRVQSIDTIAFIVILHVFFLSFIIYSFCLLWTLCWLGCSLFFFWFCCCVGVVCEAGAWTAEARRCHRLPSRPCRGEDCRFSVFFSSFVLIYSVPPTHSFTSTTVRMVFRSTQTTLRTNHDFYVWLTIATFSARLIALPFPTPFDATLIPCRLIIQRLRLILKLQNQHCFACQNPIAVSRATEHSRGINGTLNSRP